MNNSRLQAQLDILPVRRNSIDWEQENDYKKIHVDCAFVDCA